MNTLLLNTRLKHRNFIHSQEQIGNSIEKNEITFCSTGNSQGVKSAIALALASFELKCIVISKCNRTNKKFEAYCSQLGITTNWASNSLDSREVAKRVNGLCHGNHQVLFISPELLCHTEHTSDLLTIISSCCLVFVDAEKYARQLHGVTNSYGRCLNFLHSIEATAATGTHCLFKKVFLSDSASLMTVQELLKVTPHLSSEVFHSPKEFSSLRISSTLLKSEADITKAITDKAASRKSIVLGNNSKRLFNTKYFVSQDVRCISLLHSEVESKAYSKDDVFSFNLKGPGEARVAFTDSSECLGTLKASRVFINYLPHDIEHLCALLQSIQNAIPFKSIDVSFLIDFESERNSQQKHIRMKYPEQVSIEALLSKLSSLTKPYFGKPLLFSIAKELGIELFEIFSVVDLLIEFGCIKRRYNPSKQSHYFEILNVATVIPHQLIAERRQHAIDSFNELLAFFTSAECKLGTLNRALGTSINYCCSRCDCCGTTKAATKINDQPRSISSADSLRSELRVIRLTHSNKTGIPARLLFSDSTIEELINTAPTTIEQLNMIQQFSDNDRWRHFGHEIIKAVARYQF